MPELPIMMGINFTAKPRLSSDRDLLEKQLNRLAAADASTQVVLHRLPIVPREGARALQARVDGLLAQVPGAPRVSVDRRMGAGGPVVLRVALPRDVHALMHVQNHPSVRHAGVYFTPFLTDADMDAHRALRPVLAELRDCGYPDAKLRNGKILAKDRNGTVRFLGVAGAQAWIRAASAASGPGPRAPGSSEGSRGGGATGAGAASCGPAVPASSTSCPASPANCAAPAGGCWCGAASRPRTAAEVAQAKEGGWQWRQHWRPWPGGACRTGR